jgi:hypothetical protein
MKSIPMDYLDQPIQGLNLQGTTLRANLAHQPRLLVFLRHFG